MCLLPRLGAFFLPTTVRALPCLGTVWCDISLTPTPLHHCLPIAPPSPSTRQVWPPCHTYARQAAPLAQGQEVQQQEWVWAQGQVQV